MHDALVALLTSERIQTFAALALAGLRREYPNKPGDVLHGPEDLLPPRARHPVFYGCFDWHSAVHGHWMLVRLLRLHPDEAVAPRIEALLHAQFDATRLEAEAAFFRRPEHRAFERPYGWAWLLRLAAELRTWDDPRARRWADHLGPLEREIARLAREFLPAAERPVRSGLHIDSAFALASFLDYARAVGDRAFEGATVERARAWFLPDRAYPVAYEPSAFDFFSAGLNEADLMRRVLDAAEFDGWIDGFLPDLAGDGLGSLLEPIETTDPSDGHLVHVVGLNLTRAWTMRGIASALPEGDPRATRLLGAAERHAALGLKGVSSGHYAGEHWLATFAVYLLTDAALAPRTVA